MSKIVCGACGQLGREWASFCTECGTSLEVETIEQSNVPEEVLQDTDRKKEIQKAMENMSHNSAIMVPRLETDYTQTDWKTYRERQASVSMLRMASYK